MLHSEIPLDGVSVAFLMEFAAECRSILPEPETATTADVCESMVKTATGSAKCSYIALLKCTGRGHHVSQATFFFSHAWKYPFQLVVKTIKGWCEREKLDPKLCFIWFDIFTVNQHCGITDFEYWSEGFKQSISRIGRVVILFLPWNGAIWLGRAWCLYEYWVTCAGNVKHEFLLTEDDQKGFEEYIKNGGAFENIVKNVDISKAESGDKEAEQKIKLEVQRQVGFATLNENVTKGMRAWFLESSELALQLSFTNDAERLASDLYYYTAKMKMSMGHLPDATEMLVKRRAELQRRIKVEGSWDLNLAAEKDCGSMWHVSFPKYIIQWITLAAESCRAQLNSNLGEQCGVCTQEHLQLQIDEARTTGALGVTYTMQGRYDVALQMHEEALAIQKAALGESHPDTAKTIHNIGVVYYYQAKYDLAIGKYSQALAIQKAALGEIHPDTAETIHNIGELYFSEAKFDLAIEQFTQALAARKAALGESHPRTAESIVCIGLTYLTQRKYDLAIEQYTQALAVQKAALGESHPDTAETISQVGLAYHSQRKYDLAIEQYTQALVILKAALGESHPRTAQTIVCIGLTYLNQHKYDLAIEQYTQALVIQKAALGESHPTTAVIKNYIGLAYHAQGKYDLAIEQYTQALAVQKAVLGESHPATTKTKRNLECAQNHMHMLRGDQLANIDEFVDRIGWQCATAPLVVMCVIS